VLIDGSQLGASSSLIIVAKDHSQPIELASSTALLLIAAAAAAALVVLIV